MELSTTLNPFILPHDRGMEPYLQELRNYRALGFTVLDCICCNADMPGSPLLRADWQTWGQALAAESRRLGIRYVQCHTPFYNFTDSAGGIDESIEELNRRSIALSAMLGAQWVVMHPATAYSHADMPGASFAQNLAYFTPHVRQAASLGLGIAIENMADFPAQGYPRSYCVTPQELITLTDALCETLQVNNVGICWDFGHANLNHTRQGDCIRALGPRLKAVHTHDNFGREDTHLPPFFGTVNWEDCMQALSDIGYAGVLDFEVKRISLGLPLQVRNAQWQYVHTAGTHLLQLFDAAQRRGG